MADVVKSFDTIDRGVLDYVLGGLGLPVWFRKVYFANHANEGLRFKLSCGYRSAHGHVMVGRGGGGEGGEGGRGLPQVLFEHGFYCCFLSSLV